MADGQLFMVAAAEVSKATRAKGAKKAEHAFFPPLYGMQVIHLRMGTVLIP